MKRSTLYIILFLIVAAVALLLFTGNKKEREMDDRITLRRTDKIPYGSYVAYENLKHIFPHAAISTTTATPGYWDSLSNYTDGQAIVIISPRFYADEFEMKTLIRFMESGNDVFISARDISGAAEDILLGKTSTTDWDTDNNGKPEVDSIAVRLVGPTFTETDPFYYKGARFNAWFYQLDSTITDVLGVDDKSRANFIHLKSGRGNLYFHLSPLSFSNYFLLQRDNMAYYENALSVISPGTRKIVWDEYFIDKEFVYQNPNNSTNSYSGNRDFVAELIRYKEFKAALLVALLALLLFVLLEMRRKQRFIPAFTKPRNDSLDFVKTIGRLYHDKGDHRNLCHKMGAYFLEHVRNKYKLPTSFLDENFVKKLQFKTGGEEFEIREIVFFIKYIDELHPSVPVTDNQLVNFHKQLESFYQKA